MSRRVTLLFATCVLAGGCGQTAPVAVQNDSPGGGQAKLLSSADRHSAAQDPHDDSAHHVYPGEEIQAALERAAGEPTRRTVKVHAGTYRPSEKAQAFLYFNRRHDGITLQAVGEVVLTAANPSIADEKEASYPAVVNHVVYFGDGVSQKTVLRGFTITGANGFTTRSDKPISIQPEIKHSSLKKGLFFYNDGGAIKIFGRSYPTIENVGAYGNSTTLCGGAVSVEHRGFHQHAVVFRDCVFQDNSCPATGSAIDLLPGSAAIIENCLLVGNIANTGMDQIKETYGLTHHEKHGCGALTVFDKSRVTVTRCTFTANWNGADDRGAASIYRDSIFWMNTAGDGSRTGGPYEIDILNGKKVQRCYIHGNIDDLRGSIPADENVLQAPDPRFDPSYRPQNRVYSGVGYRPKG